MTDSYLVVELGTGLVDGWYRDRVDAHELKQHWDDVRFPYKHIVVAMVEPDRDGRSWLPNSMMMNKQPVMHRAKA